MCSWFVVSIESLREMAKKAELRAYDDGKDDINAYTKLLETRWRRATKAVSERLQSLHRDDLLGLLHTRGMGDDDENDADDYVVRRNVRTGY